MCFYCLLSDSSLISGSVVTETACLSIVLCFSLSVSLYYPLYKLLADRAALKCCAKSASPLRGALRHLHNFYWKKCFKVLGLVANTWINKCDYYESILWSSRRCALHMWWVYRTHTQKWTYPGFFNPNTPTHTHTQFPLIPMKMGMGIDKKNPLETFIWWATQYL